MVDQTRGAIIYCAGLLDGTGAPAILDAAVRIEGERIAAVGPAAALAPHAGERLVEHDLRPYWVTPGLIDEHTHLGLAGDGRTYEDVIALRAVQTDDFMTADWSHLPYELLAKVSTRVINEVKGVNRVVYDVSSKPPATIEWE